jgi:hypothetical protein
MLDNISAAHRPPRQAKAGLPPGRGGSIDGKGQPPFIPTDAQRAEVRKLRACGFTNESISVIMTIPETTLKRCFAWELAHGKTIVDAKILGGIVDMALDGDRTMSIFYARARGGWKQNGDDQNSSSQPVFSIKISHDSNQPRDTGHQIAIHSLPQPEEEP